MALAVESPSPLVAAPASVEASWAVRAGTGERDWDCSLEAVALDVAEDLGCDPDGLAGHGYCCCYCCYCVDDFGALVCDFAVAALD